MKLILVFIFLILLSQTACTTNKFNVVTIQGDTFNLIELSNSSENYFIILFSYSYNCFDCFRGVVKDLDSLGKQKDLDYIFVADADNSSLNRRRQIETIQQFKKDAKIYFDIPNSKNIFKHYKIDVAPAIIHIHNSKINYISFEYLAKNNHKYYDIFEKLIK
jgi:thioredoxin-related protein